MPLHFVKKPGELQPAGAHVGRISAGISSKQQLMNALEAALRLPAYFGQNWDALSDALRDLSWLPAGKISLLHHELPTLSTEDLGAYVRVLEEASRSWRPGEAYSLDVVFPRSCRHRVLAPLGDLRPRSPWRRLKAELARAGGLSYPVEREFTSLKAEGFDFVMSIVEQRDGSTRQLANALSMAFTMRHWDRTRLARALPSLCIYEERGLRETAVRILLILLDLNRMAPGERIPYDDARSCAALLHKALALGVQENTEAVARKHLARMS
ncbi:barstar family protein [Myxococcus qinghaiensis]|uniref:barstar family protein n=1 Tax=Myxococcus qinghaiensis TaxID=2906758 RepID=UPI0020A726AB|nr:barstar family protein [Myxococcus qinghaiensis]MCP3167050.1 barstar family protein [Myxococcus qinghaiensis]